MKTLKIGHKSNMSLYSNKKGLFKCPVCDAVIQDCCGADPELSDAHFAGVCGQCYNENHNVDKYMVKDYYKNLVCNEKK